MYCYAFHLKRTISIASNYALTWNIWFLTYNYYEKSQITLLLLMNVRQIKCIREYFSRQLFEQQFFPMKLHIKVRNIANRIKLSRCTTTPQRAPVNYCWVGDNSIHTKMDLWLLQIAFRKKGVIRWKECDKYQITSITILMSLWIIKSVLRLLPGQMPLLLSASGRMETATFNNTCNCSFSASFHKL